jgi:hypothetical protein
MENKDMERKIVKIGEDNSSESLGESGKTATGLKKDLTSKTTEQQKVAKLINVFFVGLFIVYLMYLYL